jgi:electron transfer flavoprotein beta subunit
MKAVCMNPIRFELSEAGDRIDCGSRTLVMNEIDEYVLEQALVMREEFGGNITVLSLGGLSSQDALYVAKAKGVDRAIRVAADGIDPISISEILAKAIGKLSFDLVLTGVESSDNMTGQTGICLAEKLGLPFAYAVTAIDAKSSSGFVRVTKELGGGVYQVLDIRLPAVLCIQSGIQPLKYTPPARVLRARKEPLEVYSLPDMGPMADRTVQMPRFVSLFKPESTRKTEMLEGEPTDIASVIVQKILEAS